MSGLCSTSEVIERLKDIVSIRYGNVYIKDLDIAYELNMSSKRLAIYKHRNSLPYKNILMFCKKYSINPLKILIKKGF